MIQVLLNTSVAAMSITIIAVVLYVTKTCKDYTMLTRRKLRKKQKQISDIITVLSILIGSTCLAVGIVLITAYHLGILK